MKRIVTHLVIPGLALGLTAAVAQTHKVAKPEAVVRAVGVYEWTGDLARPTASRLIPVSLAINGGLEDAGVYLARPIPFALQPGNDYILQAAGVDRGSIDLLYARHLQNADSTYEDGWFGYGSYKPPAPPPKQPVLRAAKTPPVIVGSDDSSRPHLTRKDGSGDAGTSTTSTNSKSPSDADPDRPHLTRKDDPGTDTSKDSSKPDSGNATTASSNDPDRPTMRRRTSDTSDDSASTTTSSTSSPADDPDRPTLKRHSADEGKKSSANDVARVSSTGSLNNDPDRPNLHRGRPASAMTEADFPKLTGLPTNLHQMIAVSDATNRPEHSFTLAWDDEAEHTSVLKGMQALARAQLAATSTPSAKPAAPQTSAKSPARPATRTVRASRTAHPAPALEPLLDEDLRAYTLSYGASPTYVYTAHTAGEGATLRYITVVAEKDSMGTLKPALRSATDAAHLDRTPRMRLVDVVDADASNRGSLLFELRAQSSRQFALYRVIGDTADQTLITGSTQ